MQLYGPKELAASLRTVRENTIKIVEDIPEERYGYRPTPESRSVEQLALVGSRPLPFPRALILARHPPATSIARG